MDRTVWKKSIILTTFDDTRYFYIDNGYYRSNTHLNIYCIGIKSNFYTTIWLVPAGRDMIERVEPQISDKASGLKIYKTPIFYMRILVNTDQIRFKNYDAKFNKVLLSEKELSDEQVLNYFKNI